MRVLLLLGSGELAGIQRHVLALVRNLPPEIHAHVCFLLEPGPASRLMQDAGVGVTVLGARSGHDLASVGRLRLLMAQVRPDVVHEHEGRLLPLVVLNVLCRRPALIHTEHCSLDASPSRWRDRVLYGLIASRACTITAVSSATAAAVSRLLPWSSRKVEVVRNGVDISRLRPPADLRKELGLPAAAQLVGSVGRLAKQKGWFDLIEVGKRMVRRSSRVHVVIGGDGPLQEELKKAVDETGVASHFHLLGARPDGDAVIAGLDLFLLTSYHEEMPTTVLEALGQGTPIAGFIPDGGYSEILAVAGRREVAVALPTRNLDDLAHEAARLLDHSGRRDRFTDVGRSLVREHFDMARISGLYARLYDSCLAARCGQPATRRPCW